MSDKKSKVQPKSLKNLIFGIPANVAVGPLGFLAELDVSPKADENNPSPSRIVSRQDRESQGPPAPETPALSIAIGEIEHGGDTAEEDAGNTGQEDSEPKFESKEPEPYHKDSVRTGAATTSDVAQKAVVGFGPLKTTLRELFAVCTDHEETSAVRNKLEVLLWRIASLDSVFALPPGNVPEMRRQRCLIDDLEAIGGKLQSLYENLTGPLQDSEDVFKSLEDLQEKIFVYQTAQQTTANNQRLKQIDPADATILNDFPSAQKAEYRHSNRSGCLKGTRSAILDEIELWSRDHDKPPVYWLNGLAGTGKTTIAQTVAERIFADGRLGASFFCSRGFEERSNLQFIFPTIAVQLARIYPEFRSIFVPLVRSDPGVAHESLCGQMNKLIVQPLEESRISTVVVVDALDECKDEGTTLEILSVLDQFVAEIPKVKFIVTGRPEPRIRTGFRLPLLAKSTDVFVLHEVESSQVDNDVRTFFKHKFSEIKNRQPGLVNWPSEEQLEKLCERAAGLFVYAVATVRCIDQKNKNPESQLDRLLRSLESTMEGKVRLTANTTLDSLYTTILHEAFGDGDPEDHPKIRSILGAVILATNPLSPSTIAAILGYDAGDVSPFLLSIHSLLILREDADHPVQPFHTSFSDFIIDPTRCVDSRFRVDPSDQHAEILVGCLKLLNQRLEQNMCGLPDCVTNSEVEDLEERVERYVDKALQYACKSWHKHLVDPTPLHMIDITPVLNQFLETKFLFWLEVLSILGATKEVVDALEACARWLDASPTVNDYIYFVAEFSQVIDASAPHIYHSALVLSPRTSIVRERYGRYARPLARVVWGLPASWEPIFVTNTLDYGFHVGVEAARVWWSPCNRFLAYAVGTSVKMLDAVTLNVLWFFGGPLAGALELGEISFSSDGRVVALCFEGLIVRRDLRTGGEVANFSTQHKKTRSSTHSMDGKLFAVLFEDSPGLFAMVTYDLLSGTHINQPRTLKGRVITPIWTHGEHIRFATVEKGSIVISEVGFTLTRGPAEVQSFPAPDGVEHAKTDHLFLPTLFRLAFIHKGKVFVWDARSAKFLLESTFGWYTRMSFSSNGRFLASTTDLYQEVHVWKDSSTGYRLCQKLPRPSKVGPSPALSPSGGSMVVAYRDAICLWSTSVPVLSPSDLDHPNSGASIVLAFSPDTSLAAIGRFRRSMVTVVDLESGDSRSVIDTGMRVRFLAVTGSTLVAVGDENVVAWTLPTGDRTPNASVEIETSVQWIATLDHPGLSPDDFLSFITMSISRDLNRIAIAKPSMGYENLNVYDLPTGRLLAGANVTLARTLEFTPDGCEVWIGNSPKSMEGWSIAENNDPGLIKLDPPETAGRTSEFPERSCGHRVDDEWVLDYSQRRILWLPDHWRRGTREWAGRFLGFTSWELGEAVILEFFG